jgi:hypothetical protein
MYMLYADGIVFIASCLELLQRTATALQHFLSISMEQQPEDLFLQQRQYDKLQTLHHAS